MGHTRGATPTSSRAAVSLRGTCLRRGAVHRGGTPSDETAARAAWLNASAPVAETWPDVVDAVTAVLAPEIERPLQARITELEAELERAESSYVEARAVVELRQSERDAAQARVTELKTENLHLSLELEAHDDAQWDLHQRLLPELAEAKEENRRLHAVVHHDFLPEWETT